MFVHQTSVGLQYIEFMIVAHMFSDLPFIVCNLFGPALFVNECLAACNYYLFL